MISHPALFVLATFYISIRPFSVSVESSAALKT